MANPIWSAITALVTPVTEMVDALHTSDEERLQARAAIFGLQSELSQTLIEYESKLLAAKSSVIIAEAQGQSWLQRSWRPITMLTFLVLVVLDTMGLTAFRLSDQAWTLLQIGLGGYVVGRSVEKTVPSLMQAMRKD
uniref:3TM-type holin n=1 Tax=Marinobacterium profundum TaxID=1714300 RepID=UPI000830E481|nr:3TM-type holin [Marinobacterium profundum]